MKFLTIALASILAISIKSTCTGSTAATYGCACTADDTVCTSCTDATNNQLVELSGQKQCIPKDDNCTTFNTESNLTASKCMTCKINFVVKSGDAARTCVTNGSIAKIASCTTYQADDLTKCTECLTAKTLSQDLTKCSTEITDCKYTDNSTVTECVECVPTKGVKESDKSCMTVTAIDNCATYTDATHCAVCKATFVLGVDKLTCVSLGSETAQALCVEYTNATDCHLCKASNHLLTTKKCAAGAGVTECRVHTAVADCFECKAGKYRKAAAECAAAVTCDVSLNLTSCKCDTTDAQGVCVTCEASKKFMAGTPAKCVAMVAGCNVYDATSTNAAGKCKTCISATHFTGENMTCIDMNSKPALAKCLEYKGAEECGKCETTHDLKDKKCVLKVVTPVTPASANILSASIALFALVAALL